MIDEKLKVQRRINDTSSLGYEEENESKSGETFERNTITKQG